MDHEVEYLMTHFQDFKVNTRPKHDPAAPQKPRPPKQEETKKQKDPELDQELLHKVVNIMKKQVYTQQASEKIIHAEPQQPVANPLFAGTLAARPEIKKLQPSKYIMN